MALLRRVWILVVVVAATPVVAAPAAAATTTGSATDPAGDAPAGRDVTAATVSYDGDTGAMTAAVTFQAQPARDDAGLVLALFGTKQADTTCKDPSVGLFTTLGEGLTGSRWTLTDASGTETSGEGAAPLDGTTVTMQATDQRLVGFTPDCVVIATSDADAGLVDTLIVPVTVSSTPPPTTTPTTTTTTPPATTETTPPATTQTTPTTTTPTATTPVPAPTPPPPAAPTPPAAMAPKLTGAHLELGLPTVKAGRRGVARTTRITVRNRGTETAARPVVRLILPRGVSARRTKVTLKAIPAGKSARTSFSIKVGARAKATATIGVRVSTTTKGTARSAKGVLPLPVKQPTRAQRLSAALKACAKRPASKRTACRTAARKRFGRAPTTTAPGAPGQPGAPTTPSTPPAEAATLVGRYFLYYAVDVTLGQTTKAYYFVNGQFAYRGVPEGGLPACTAPTAVPEPDGDPGDGCVPYTFDPATRALTIDGQPATVDATLDNLTVGEDAYPLKPVPPAGSRFDLSLKAIRQTGVAPFNATVSTRYLTMNAAGQFILSSETIGSIGGGASSPGGANFYASNPDRSGTYEIVAGGGLVLTFGDGHVDRYTIAIDRKADGDVNPATAGLLLDDGFFFKDDDA